MASTTVPRSITTSLGAMSHPTGHIHLPGVILAGEQFTLSSFVLSLPSLSPLLSETVTSLMWNMQSYGGGILCPSSRTSPWG